MNTTTFPKFKSLLHSLPEIWYILLLITGIVSCLQTVNSIITLFSVAILALLIKQLFYKNTKLSIVFGALLSIGAFYMLMAMLSEYSEFQDKNDPKAIQLLMGGCLICGTSLILSIQMLVQGIRKIS